MKLTGIIGLLLPILALVYVFWRTWRILPLPVGWKVAVLAVMLVLFVLIPVCMAPGSLDGLSLPVASLVYKLSLSWVFVLIYLFIAFVVIDILGLFHVAPPSFRVHSLVGTATVAGVLFIIFLGGNLHYHHKHREAIAVKTSKPLAKPLKVVMLSDIHLGYHIRRGEFAKWVDKINAENPDLVLVAGDIIDRSVEPLLKDGQAQEFHRIKAPIYGCPGNHEYYAGIDASQDFYRLAGVTMLRDSAVEVKGVNIVGRDDKTNARRKSLAELMQGVDRSKFTFLLDHQPFHLEEAEQAGVDFQFSGHTHYGQVWPVSWITDAIYEDAFGPLTKGATQYYVSSGIGIWGGKFRIGTRSEYVVLTVG